MRGTYKVAERIFVAMTIPFFAYPIAAILAHPHWGQVGRSVVAPHVQTSPAYVLLFVATAGTTITPFMQLYLQSAVVERGLGPDDLTKERIEVVSGSVFANLVASFIIIATAATLYLHGHRQSTPPPRRPRRSHRSPAGSPRCCSPWACSGRACSRRRSCR